jgi:hypothetical protein
MGQTLSRRRRRIRSDSLADIVERIECGRDVVQLVIEKIGLGGSVSAAMRSNWVTAALVCSRTATAPRRFSARSMTV